MAKYRKKKQINCAIQKNTSSCRVKSSEFKIQVNLSKEC